MTRARGRSLAAAIALGAAAAGAVVAAPAPARAWCRILAQSDPAARPGDCGGHGPPVQWEGGCTGYSFNPDTSVELDPADVRAALRASVRRWYDVGCGAGNVRASFHLVPAGDTSEPAGAMGAGRGIHSISFNTVWRDPDTSTGRGVIYNPEAVAITRVYRNTTTGVIFDADIEFNQGSADNPDGFHFSVSTDRDPPRYDLQTIATHELGHFLGLGHTDMSIPAAVMAFSVDPGEWRRFPRDDDARGLCDAYPPDQAGMRSCALENASGCRAAPALASPAGGALPAGGWRGGALAVGVVALYELARRGRRAVRSS